MDYHALWAEIQANPACAPHIHTNDMPKIGSAEAVAKDRAIADILSDGRKRRQSNMITERGVREALPILDASVFLKALRELETATELPAGIADLLTLAGVPADDHWAYLETLKCGWSWLRGDGLDVGSDKVAEMLELIGGGIPASAAACLALTDLAWVDDPITADDVSRAVRGPRD
jgi:hypothetical protein